MGSALLNYSGKENHEHEFTCEICFELLLPVKKFKNHNRCVHPICIDCISNYIVVTLEDNISDIRCPALNCKQFLDPTCCRNLVSPRQFVKWCDMLFQSDISRLAHCNCPSWNCSALIVDECGGNVKQSRCPNCKRFFCFQCITPWHAGFYCGESRDIRDRDDDVAFVSLAERKKWKRCPQCRHCVERIDGCNTVKCRCGAYFCYICGKAGCIGYRHGPQEPDRTACVLCCFIGVFCIVASFYIMALVL